MAVYRGHVDTYKDGIIEGWACDIASPETSVTVRVMFRGEEVGAVVADQFRQDLFDAGIGDGTGRYMFRFALPEPRPAIAPYELSFLAEGGEELTGSPLQIVEQAGALYRLRTAEAEGAASPDLEILPAGTEDDEDLPMNSGLVVLNRSQSPAGPRTVIVVGHARSGTSMIARALHIAGLPMGLPIPVPANYEDEEFVEALHGAVERPPLDTARIDELIRDRNSRHSDWGFKAPAALHSLSYLLHHTRNPHLVVVFRDTLAISIRERLAVDADLWESFESILAYEALLLRVLRNTDVPCLLLSYEKALLNPRSFCMHLAQFAMPEADPLWIEDALGEMNPNQRDYVEGVRDVRRYMAMAPFTTRRGSGV